MFFPQTMELRQVKAHRGCFSGGSLSGGACWHCTPYGDNFGNWCCSNHGNWHCHQGFGGYNAYSVTVYSCPSGGSLSGTTCVFPSAYAAAVSYSCPVNTGIATVSGSTCVYPAAYNATANP